MNTALTVAAVLVLFAAILMILSKEVTTRRKLVISGLSGLAIVTLATFAGLGLSARNVVQETTGQYIFTEDWMTRNVDSWNSVFKNIKGKSGLRALEVGSFEGRSAIWLLENVLTDPSSSITCIDIFGGPYEKTFDHNMQSFGQRVKKIKASSHEALRTLERNSYDFAYIDGSHVAKNVLVDAALTWDLIKLGGIIIFDDYLWSGAGRIAFVPHIAINAFLSVFEPYIDVIQKDYQVIVRKRTKIKRDSPQLKPIG